MKTNVKKFLKISLPIVGVGIVSTSIVFLSGCLVQTPIVSLGGSTGVLPLINALTPYINFIDVVTSAGGSGVGISSIIDGTKEVGMASTRPEILDLPTTNSKYQIWDEKKVKTVTIAWDGIALVYKPSEIPQNANELIVINENNLAKIYSAFSGQKQVQLGDLLNNGDQTIITPYARNGGSNVSGTTDAFLKDSHLDYENSAYWKSLTKDEQDIIHNAITNGNYGHNVIQTAESNSQAWNVAKNGPKGSMVYLSTGFVMNNRAEIEKYGFKVALYKGTTPVEPTPDTIASTYNWYRPLNLIYSMSYVKNMPEIVKMIAWILFDQEAKRIIIEEKYTPLNEMQLQSMGWNGVENDIDFLTNDNYDTGTYDTKLGWSGAK